MDLVDSVTLRIDKEDAFSIARHRAQYWAINVVASNHMRDNQEALEAAAEGKCVFCFNPVSEKRLEILRRDERLPVCITCQRKFDQGGEQALNLEEL